MESYGTLPKITWNMSEQGATLLPQVLREPCDVSGRHLIAQAMC